MSTWVFLLPEDDGIAATLAFTLDDGTEQSAFLLRGPVAARGFQLNDFLGDRLGGSCRARDFDASRIGQEQVGEAFDFGGHRGGEEQRLAGEWRQREDALDVGNETHVEHAVGLVHHHDLDAGQQELATFEMVEKTAWRRDQHVDPAVDQCVLFLEADPADEQRLGELDVS